MKRFLFAILLTACSQPKPAPEETKPSSESEVQQTREETETNTAEIAPSNERTGASEDLCAERCHGAFNECAMNCRTEAGVDTECLIACEDEQTACVKACRGESVQDPDELGE